MLLSQPAYFQSLGKLVVCRHTCTHFPTGTNASGAARMPLSWLRTRALSSDSCAEPHRCVGTVHTGADTGSGSSGDGVPRCVCYADGE